MVPVMTQGTGSEAALSFGRHARETVALALPVMVARAGSLVMITVNTVQVGRAGVDELAYFALGAVPQVFVMMIGLGALIGTSVLVSQADGAGRPEECGPIWRSAIQLSVVMGLIASAICAFGHHLFIALGQSAELSAGAGRVLQAATWQMPAHFIGIATTFYLESIKRPQIGMIAMLVANIVNALVGWVLIYGHWGFEAMGAEGAVYATGVARWIVAGGTVGYALLMADHARYRARGAFFMPWAASATLRRLGLPFGVAQGVETLSFQAMIVFAGWLGPVALGGYQIAMNMVVIVFMTAIGLATATGVRVGNAVGYGSTIDRDRAGLIGIGLTIAAMSVFSALFLLEGETIIGLYTNDAGLIAACLPVVLVASLMLIFDGLQTVLVAAVRGAGDAWMPTAMQTIAFWGAMTPVGYWLAFPQGYGAPGLMAGAAVGVVVASLLLAFRFWQNRGRQVRRL